MDANETNKHPPAIPLHKAFFRVWADLFRTRKGLLFQGYLEVIQQVDPGFVLPATLEEVRTRYYEVIKSPAPSERDLDHFESLMVAIRRWTAVWFVLWSTILPLCVIAWYCAGIRQRRWGLPLVIQIPAFVLMSFPILYTLGIILMSFLNRPFQALLCLVFDVKPVPGNQSRTPGQSGK